MARRYTVTIKNGHPTPIIERHPTMIGALIKAKEQVSKDDIPIIDRLFYEASKKLYHSSRMEIENSANAGGISLNIHRIRYSSL